MLISRIAVEWSFVVVSELLCTRSSDIDQGINLEPSIGIAYCHAMSDVVSVLALPMISFAAYLE